MPEIFPYQLVGFLDQQPEIGEPVYGGGHGWYPQIALKRRFAVKNVSEGELCEVIQKFCSQISPFVINVGELVTTQRMPVKVLEVEQSQSLMDFHIGFIEMLGTNLVSRYPERDGVNYYPHITAEYDGRDVIDAGLYANKQFTISTVWLLKDVDNEDSRAYAKFELSRV